MVTLGGGILNRLGYNLSKIKKLRELNNMSQSDIAQLLDLTLQGYGKKENGERKFTLEESKKLSDLYGVAIEELFFYSTSNQNVNKPAI